MADRIWIRADLGRERARVLTTLDLPPTLAVVDAHRRLRGPYTAAGSLIRLIADELLDRCPELVARHNTELLTSTPELAGRVPDAWRTLEWFVGDEERTRFYSRLHTRNIANGLAELVRDYLRALGPGRRTLVVENAHEADPTDQELIAILLRRGDLSQLVVVVGTSRAPLADPPGEIDVSLRDELMSHAEVIDGTPAEPRTPSDTDEVALAKAYVDSDGTTDDPRSRSAYANLPPETRSALHDARAAVLRRSEEFSLHLGAIPYHAEHGSDPSSSRGDTLRRAMDHCRTVGLYQAAADFGLRGRAVVDKDDDAAAWWHFTKVAGEVMASLGRADEAESLYLEARAESADPLVHMDLAYDMAMLHARHYAEPQRDYQQARAWMKLCRAIASTLSERKAQAFESVFADNGLALVEVRQARPALALELLNTGMARLDEQLEPHEHILHRTVLHYNRAQVLDLTGRLEEALEDYSAVLELDPRFPEHHFNIANILRKLDRHEEALAGYRRALELSPPFPEAYYNVGDTLMALGDTTGALSAFAYTIELDPKHVDARINRAALLLEAGDAESAQHDVTIGLSLAPDNAHLLSLEAQLLADRGEYPAAAEVLAKATDIDPSLAEAWALRGTVALASSDPSHAIDCLNRAVDLRDGPEIRFNRAAAHQELDQLTEAIADYDAVLAVLDDPDARQQRASCIEAIRPEQVRTPT